MQSRPIECAQRTRAMKRPAAALACGVMALLTQAAMAASPSTGSAAGATATGTDGQLQTCTDTLGTVRLSDGATAAQDNRQSQPASGDGMSALVGALRGLSNGNKQQAPAAAPNAGALEALRLVIQQSNCFVIVERGAAAADMKAELAEARGSNETRDGSNVGPGQQVVADYLLRSTVISMGVQEKQGLDLGILGKVLGGAKLNRSTTAAKVQLLLLDIRSGAQLAASQGEGSGSNTGLAMGLLGGAGKALGGVGAKSESTTSESTVLLQAFADAYNKLVPALQNYKAQMVKGGLGTGGALGVQGARSDPSAVGK